MAKVGSDCWWAPRTGCTRLTLSVYCCPRTLPRITRNLLLPLFLPSASSKLDGIAYFFAPVLLESLFNNEMIVIIEPLLREPLQQQPGHLGPCFLTPCSKQRRKPSSRRSPFQLLPRRGVQAPLVPLPDRKEDKRGDAAGQALPSKAGTHG